MIKCDCCNEKIQHLSDVVQVEPQHMPPALKFEHICSTCSSMLTRIKTEVFKRYQQGLENEIKQYMRLPRTTDIGVPLDDFTRQPVEKLYLTQRTENILRSEGILFIHQLLEQTEIDLLKLRQIGKKSLREIKDVLASCGDKLGRDDLHLMPTFKKRYDGLSEHGISVVQSKIPKKKAVKTRKRWSKSEDEQLLLLREQGREAGYIAEQLGRSRKAVEQRAHKLRHGLVKAP